MWDEKSSSLSSLAKSFRSGLRAFRRSSQISSFDSEVGHSEHFFETVCETVPTIAFLADETGRTLYFNSRWEEYTGIAPTELSEDTWGKAIHPEDFPEVARTWVSARDNVHKWTQEYRLRRRDGTYRWHLGVTVPEKNQLGKLRKWIGIVTDIEDQKAAQFAIENAVTKRTKELSQSQSFLDSVIENIPNMVFVKDAKELRFVRFNRAGEKLLGFNRADLLGKNDYDFFPKSQADHFISKDREVLSGHSIVDIPEEIIQTKSGERILHTRKIPIFGSSGKPEYLLGISEDITELKKAESKQLELIESKIKQTEGEKTVERLKFLADASNVLGLSLNLEETLRNLTNLAVPALGDWCSVQLIQSDGKLKQLAVAHKDPEKIKWAWELQAKYPPEQNSSQGPSRVVKTGKSEMMQIIPKELLQQAAKDKEHQRILEGLGFHSYICTPIKIRNEIIGALTLVTTTESGRFFSETDLRLAEDLCGRAGIAVENARLYREAQSLNRVKDEFLAALSHELRTPITVIQGHADLLASDLDQMGVEELKNSISTIQRNTRLQTQIVADLLDVSSIITGKISYSPQKISPEEIILGVYSAVKLTAENKGVKVSCDLSKAPKTMWADPTRLHQILWNLANNAIKFTNQGGSVKLVLKEEGDKAIFSVVDTGIGIDPNFIYHVFDRFTQADSSRSRRYGGLGLGLSIVKSLAELHGGDVSVKSDGVGKGSAFTVTLPLRASAVVSEEMAASRQKSGVEQPKALPKIADVKILLVEDSADNRVLVSRLLQKHGAKVTEAASANEARRILETEKPDVIVSDIGMPDENGLEFMKRLRDSKTSIPAIALTAYVRPQEVEEVLRAGFQAHIPKPITPDDLIRQIANLSGRSN